MKKYILVAAFATTFISCKTSQKIKPEDASKQLRPNPHFVVDGKESDKSVMLGMSPENVASITTIYKKEATRMYGDKAKDGVIEIETKAYAQDKYQQVFKQASSEYKNILEAESGDNNFQYILNGKALTENDKGTLATITPALLKEIKIIEKQELNSRFNGSDKSIGVLIIALTPKNLYKGKEKFNQK